MTDDEYAEIRRVLTQRRQSLGFSQQEVVERMGYKNASTLGQLENGYPKRPDLRVLQLWADAVWIDLTAQVTLSFRRTDIAPRTYDITPRTAT